MKKLFVIALLLANLAAHSQPLRCLNGYSKSDALAMRMKFLSTGKSVRTPTSVWFDKDIIGKMLDLMKKEKTPGGNGPDGIRIYFGTNASNYNTVILVSTYAFGADPTVASGTFHQDYFDHDTTDILFKSTGINGEIRNDSDSTHGARLYQACNNGCRDDSKCSDNNSRNFHYITRVYGEGMVTEFGVASGNIETNCEWFDLALLSEIDSEMRSSHPNDYAGLRVYFGRHMKYDYFSPNKDAFVVEPTIKWSVNPAIHMDFFNCNAASDYFDRFNKAYKNKLAITNVYMGQFLNSFLDKQDSDEKWNSITISSVVKTLIANGVENGEICPTHCPGTTL